MKNLIKRLKRQAQAYIDFHAQPAADINLKTHKIITTIKEAQEKQLALHAIYTKTAVLQVIWSNTTQK